MSKLFKIVTLGSVAVGLGLLTGCHTDMWVQPKLRPQQASDFFADKQASRPLLPNTVVHKASDADLRVENPRFTGFIGGRMVQGKQIGGKLVDTIPPDVVNTTFHGSLREMLERGQERFNIACSPCHSRLGDGNGMIALRGFALRRQPADYHAERLRNAPIGHFFDVITNGFGAMYPAAVRVPEPDDRWAIAAYIRVLQACQNVNPAELTPEDLQKLEEAKRRQEELRRKRQEEERKKQELQRLPAPPTGREGIPESQ